MIKPISLPFGHWPLPADDVLCSGSGILHCKQELDIPEAVCLTSDLNVFQNFYVGKACTPAANCKITYDLPYLTMLLSTL